MEDIARSASVAALWAGLCLLLMVVLSALVVRQRRTHRVGVGDAGIDSLQRAGRAFGNAAEYVPAGLAVLTLFALLAVPPPSMHLAGATLFTGRVLHAIGLSRSTGATLPRTLGMILTYLFLICAAVTLIVYAV